MNDWLCGFHLWLWPQFDFKNIQNITLKKKKTDCETENGLYFNDVRMHNCLLLSVNQICSKLHLVKRAMVIILLTQKTIMTSQLKHQIWYLWFGSGLSSSTVLQPMLQQTQTAQNLVLTEVGWGAGGEGVAKVLQSKGLSYHENSVWRARKKLGSTVRKDTVC